VIKAPSAAQVKRATRLAQQVLSLLKGEPVPLDPASAGQQPAAGRVSKQPAAPAKSKATGLKQLSDDQVVARIAPVGDELMAGFAIFYDVGLTALEPVERERRLSEFRGVCADFRNVATELEARTAATVTRCSKLDEIEARGEVES
jgi:hypothetical protein